MRAPAQSLRALQGEQKAAVVRWEGAVRELETALVALARLEQKVERYTLNIFRPGGHPITPRQRKAIEASRLVTGVTGGVDQEAGRRRVVYDSRIDEVRALEARWKPRIDAARARVHAAKAERHEAAQEVLAAWPDPEPLTGHTRRSLAHL